MRNTPSEPSRRARTSFVEKPLAQTVADAQRVVDGAKAHGRKLMAGYILRVHPSWTRFVELARTLGKPLVMRMNLNQQSIGAAWTWHCNLMQSLSPLVDCGVHYVDIMCQMSGARPVRVHGIGARLADNVKVPNYGIYMSSSTTGRSAGTRPAGGR
jgi:predicted dehydrogenase